MTKRGRQTVFSNWRDQMPMYLMAVAAWLAIFAWKLNSLLPGFSGDEVKAVAQSSSLHGIWNNPIDAPYKLTTFASRHLLHSQAGIRAAGVFWSLIFIYSFYLIIARWFGKMVALLATLVMATTPIIIVAARGATPMIMALSLLPVVAGLLGISKSTRANWLIYAIAILSGLAVYHAGLIWLVLLLVVPGIIRFGRLSSKVGKLNLVGALVTFLIVIAPLVVQIVRAPSLARVVLALPAHWPSVIAIAKNFAWAILSLIWRAPYHVDWIIGRLSIFSVIEISLVVIGVFAMLNHARSKAMAILAYSALGLLLEAINGNLSYILAVVPAALIFAAAGIRFLYYEWNSVFPYNPLPRTLANLAMLSILFVQCTWGVRYSLIAWPLSPATHQTYHAIIKQ